MNTANSPLVHDSFSESSVSECGADHDLITSRSNALRGRARGGSEGIGSEGIGASTTSVDPSSVGAAVSGCDNGQGCNTPVEEALKELRELKRVIELDWMPALYLALDNVTHAIAGIERAGEERVNSGARSASGGSSRSLGSDFGEWPA